MKQVCFIVAVGSLNKLSVDVLLTDCVQSQSVHGVRLSESQQETGDGVSDF